MRQKQFVIACVFVILTISLAGAQVALDVFKSGNDVGLDWVPANACRVDYSEILPPDYQTLVGNAPPMVYHSDVLDNGVTYYYNVECEEKGDQDAAMSVKKREKPSTDSVMPQEHIRLTGDTTQEKAAIVRPASVQTENPLLQDEWEPARSRGLTN